MPGAVGVAVRAAFAQQLHGLIRSFHRHLHHPRGRVCHQTKQLWRCAGTFSTTREIGVNALSKVQGNDAHLQQVLDEDAVLVILAQAQGTALSIDQPLLLQVQQIVYLLVVYLRISPPICRYPFTARQSDETAHNSEQYAAYWGTNASPNAAERWPALTKLV